MPPLALLSAEMVQVPGQGSPQRDACSDVEGKHCTDRSAKTLKDKSRYVARSSLQQGIVVLKGPSFVYRFQQLPTRGIKDGPLRRRNIQVQKKQLAPPLTSMQRTA